MDNDQILSITELTRQIKEVVELGFSDVWIQGEISNFKQHSSGHLYFTLKDAGSQISAVMWRGRASTILFRPADGMNVLVKGRITVYEPRGNYQIECFQIQPVGIGELQKRFELLKQTLFSEGLFSEEYKKPLPMYPEKIAVITSPTGAAVHDIISVLARRQPSIELFVIPVKVQGIGAAEEIAEAIEFCNSKKIADVLIVGRGGGSLEDLWAFNEEVVARAIFASSIPIISAVGHEVDYSISDFVADLRAPTPSAAAELAVKDKNELIEIIRNFQYTLVENAENSVAARKESVKHIVESYHFNRPLDLIRQKSQQLDEIERRIKTSRQHFFLLKNQNLESLQLRILSLNPRQVLKRGYAIVRQQKKIIPDLKMLNENTSAEIEMHNGFVDIQVIGKRITHVEKRTK